MAEPDESAIANVCEFTGLDPIIDRELVVAALKDKSGNVESVVAAFYDDEAKFRQKFLWDEAPFIGDRDGVSESTSLPTFSIQGPDESPVIHGVSPSGLHPGTPSRPPSRTQSPLSRVIDWTTQNANAGPVSKAQEDTELQRALAESAAMSGMHSPQETGVTTAEAATNLPFFGPANREEYDPSQWAMVRASPEDQEAGPSGRKRTPGTPAFLRYRKDQPGAYNLNAILTILHSIPGTRNALLQSGTPSANYGQNSEWWKGGYIPPAGEAAPDNAFLPDSAWETPPEPTSVTAQKFSEEIHRLMAFLDGTERAYGTADSFGNNALIPDSWDDDLDRAFFTFFQEINSAEVFAKLFTEVGTIAVDDLDTPTGSDSYVILDVKIDKSLYFGELRDVYNIVDTIYWADLTSTPLEPITDSKMAIAGSLGQVQIFSIGIDGLDHPLDIPEYFYPDRYMEEHRQLALRIQLQLRSVYEALQESREARSKITAITRNSDNAKLDRAALSEQAMGLSLQKFWQLKAAAFWKSHETSIGSPEEFDFNLADVEAAALTSPDEIQIARAIQAEMAVHKKALADINKRLNKLNIEKDACERLLKRLRMRYTGPSDPEGWSPTHRYRLRGVIVSTNTYYFCRRDQVVDDDEPSREEDQWWRISCNPSTSGTWSVDKTTLKAAQEAAFSETGKPVLIYASDAAIEETPEPLSDALRTFVRFDNRLFKQELFEESPREKKRLPAETPISPSKRQQRSNSIDSMATNKASVDEFSDRDMSDVPLIDDGFVVGGGLDEGFHEDTALRPERFDIFEKDFDENSSAGIEQDGSLGTEMVQLAISRPGGMGTTGTNSSWDNSGSDASQDALDRVSNGNGNGKAEEYRYDSEPDKSLQEAQQSEKHALPHGEMQMVADWDNPEGRYVNRVDPVKES